ncbi:MAG: poly-gamma-glutamate system protein [Synergistaceae bacterium]|nr:poly-gamma-glutamate system protein [Synergistaceae bacterium]
MNIIKYRRNLLLLLALLIMSFFWIKGGTSFTRNEQLLYSSVIAAENELWQWKGTLKKTDPNTDIFKTGLIGLEWSPISTTLGDLSAKRTSCDPRWSIVVSRWLDTLNIKKGDKVLLLSSSSFPGMILNVLTALESHGAETYMILSLGSSTWGANDPDFPWPYIASHLRKKGMLHTKEKFVTLGGGNETGGGLSDEGILAMKKIAETSMTPLVVKDNLQEMIEWKMQIIEEVKPSVVINIGGGHSAMGSNDTVAGFEPGIHLSESKKAGNGVMGRSLAKGYPVIHILNIKELCALNAVPYDAAPVYFFSGNKNGALAAAGLIIFIFAMLFFKRWELM